MTIPTDSERQAQERNACMKCACVLTVLTMLISFIAFAIGAVAITKSEPVYAFPYCIGGSMIAGIFTCVSSFVQYRHYNIYSNNKGAVTKEHAQRWSRQLCLLCPCVCTSLILGLAFSGIWGMVQASAEKREVYENPNYEAFAQTNLNYAVASFVLVLILTVLQMILYCVCNRFKASYSFEHEVQGHDEFYFPLNSYTHRQPQRHDINYPYRTRENYSNTARRNQPSTTNAQAAGRNVPRLDEHGPDSTSQSERNTVRNNPSEQGRSDIFSIPKPELYQSERNTVRNNPSEQGRSDIFSIPIPELYQSERNTVRNNPSEQGRSDIFSIPIPELYQSERNTVRNNPSEQGRSVIFSIPIPELYHGGPDSSTQSERNTVRSNPSEQGRSETFSIPIPELYHGRGREATAPPSETAVSGNDANSGRDYMYRHVDA